MPDHHTLPEILEQVRCGTLDPAAAGQLISSLPVDEVANLDLNRADRCGIPEVVLAEGKDTDALVKIMHSYVRAAGRVLASRISPEQVQAVLAHLPDGIIADYREICRILILSDGTVPAPSGGTVAIVTAGTSDIRVAEEARAIAEEMGASVLTAYDVGVAGIHRLFPALEKLRDADIYVVCAGREGTLPSVVAGLVNKPVIGVPVSTGYGYMGHGEAALASMLQSCAAITVVNIDAGFTAGAVAARTAALIGGTK
ncbi:nickel pincer cofactor biosynthesis protein LarB [Methanocorpusculum vombati]|uniref:Nickel pincer cofactor biosynthesis protein LarB n=1 Tax=Methanocorpusculum vombati TaxID=3002864 RepID=A0ABT4IPX6_9EURY|nr:nickel pincer cofactor biosynthesis protein LarB [Methanocorpusculum vombati]MCZ9319971.1 nickel pincer cofactor biosynthesis protein LarB [Methanocorpusculum sp.]MCZ0863175.1 nickel pincer cofactor biosynthesis protein LarB [Methanocorpusculum vombati]MDE2520228.1 nickel pincer cofactor biosynthesis protein LarB [Methanocorpusculum sp.]MDE2533822.1 nickel pincer cofactor biosynthesis protein LarB [Methanocorpusculum sp.]MDE2546734.1 nickel pincer cofactor biosynthesis protein LarB [Methano